MKIGFHSYQLGERGTEVCLYKYAKYNQEILGNESVIISTSSRPTTSLDLFKKEFDVVLYPEIWQNDRKNDRLRNSLERICSEKGLSHFYAIKGGDSDGIMPNNSIGLAHCVFQVNEPHGHKYAGICEYVSRKFAGQHPFVDHIVENDFQDSGDLRKELGIPKDALVIGRHGGKDTFNIHFAHSAVIDALERDDIYFLFLNTDAFYHHERIIHLPYTFDFEQKAKFINTCDAMIHARRDGETFGLSVGEFSVRNKAVITCNSLNPSHGYDTAHLEFLGDKGIYYQNQETLREILVNMNTRSLRSGDWDAYSERFSPKSVMKQFNNIFLS
jgi:hypothetical protein